MGPGFDSSGPAEVPNRVDTRQYTPSIRAKILNENADQDGRLVATSGKRWGEGLTVLGGPQMRLNRTIVPVGALVMVLGVGGVSADAGQRDSGGRDRNGRESQGQARQRDGGQQDSGQRDGGQRDSARRGGGQREAAPAAPAPVAPQQQQQQQRGGGRVDGGQDRGGRYAAPVVPQQGRDSAPGGRFENRDQRGVAVPRERRGDDRPNYGGNVRPNYGGNVSPYYGGNARPNYDRGRDGRRDTFRYEAPRNNGYRGGYGVTGRQSSRHYYGSGGGFSAYFGFGSGYRFGSIYSGRVYGYSAPQVYGSRIYYGDVRLQVQPRDAAV